MSKVYLVSSETKIRVGKYDSLDKAKVACLADSKKTGEHRYTISVWNNEKNRITKTHYSFCSYYHFADCDFPQFCLDYGK